MLSQLFEIYNLLVVRNQYLSQAVAGIVIAVGAGIGIYWRKAKKKAMDKLGIDKNAKKEVEADIIEFTEVNK